ncbi:16693_t:CDS:2 [Acaulospora colombiana]|uniref:16693_t:CDS:1 n=1 Tax=Acaulospora colombiana TaxID=27376 RepID=A0ACA9LUI6_9GLOM|nr:16693_t:CDS:2 [Acaulospora colombiana]
MSYEIKRTTRAISQRVMLRDDENENDQHLLPIGNTMIIARPTAINNPHQEEDNMRNRRRERYEGVKISNSKRHT